MEAKPMSEELDLSFDWLARASQAKHHAFKGSDSTASAVHKARRDTYRKCAADVVKYEKEIRRLRAQLAEFHALADCDENDEDPMEPWEVVEQLEKIAKLHKEAT